MLRCKRCHLAANTELHVFVDLKTLLRALCTACQCLVVPCDRVALVRLDLLEATTAHCRACAQATRPRTLPPAIPRPTRPAATPRPTVSEPWLYMNHCVMALLNPMTTYSAPFRCCVPGASTFSACVTC